MQNPAQSSALAYPDEALINHFEQFIAVDSFPRVGENSALSRGQIVYQIEHDLLSGPAAATVTSLKRFSQEYDRDTALFRSVVVLFRHPAKFTELSFESALWRYLQKMHYADDIHHYWDARASYDPSFANFSFSVCGRGYYVVGLHPRSNRTARRFIRPVLVFNLHDQFEKLRSDDKSLTIRDIIIKRDTQLEGTPNPISQAFGNTSEATQYSGRAVDDQ